MPIYEYQCSTCGHQLEAIQKMTDTALTECPACHQSTLSKLISAAGFQLKGTGWYATDFRNKGNPPAKAENTEPSNSETKTTTKDDKTSSSSSSTTDGTT